MQAELTDLHPQLLKTSTETEELMVKIELDTIEVEAKKEVRFSWITTFYKFIVLFSRFSFIHQFFLLFIYYCIQFI